MANALEGITKIADLRRRLTYTLMMLAVYRLGVFITVPGVDRNVMAQYMRSGQAGFLGMFNMFSGGALQRLSIFALGVMPYISASIIIQLLTVVIPHLESLQKEGEQGRRKINEYTRYGTVLISLVQGTGLAFWLRGLNAQAARGIVLEGAGAFTFILLAVVALTAGSVLLMWIGERMTERGIGNGISLIIFAGIVARLPDALTRTFTLSTFGGGDIAPMTLVLIGVVAVGVVALVVFFERAYRPVEVRYPRQMVGRGMRMRGAQRSVLPLKVNSAGVIPPIFASSILMFPNTIAGVLPQDSRLLAWVQSTLVPGSTLYNVIYVALIVFFTYFYTAVTFNPADVADNLKRQHGFIPGIRPGKRTAEHIDWILTRITFAGAVYMSAVCVLPMFLRTEFGVPFYFGGTGLLIVVGVALDTFDQIQAHLITRNYDALVGLGAAGRTIG